MKCFYLISKRLGFLVFASTVLWSTQSHAAMTCTSSLYGKLYYDTGSNSLELCNLTNGSATTTNVVHDNGSGLVGIGTTSPSSLLEMSGQSPELTVTAAGPFGGTGSDLVLRTIAGSSNANPMGTYMFDLLSQTEWYLGRPSTLSDKFIISRSTPAAHSTGTSALADALVTVLPTGYVGIGTTAPNMLLSIYNNTATATAGIIGDGELSDFYSTSYANSATGPFFVVQKARGTMAAPAAVNAGDSIGSIAYQGFDGTSFASNAKILGYAEDTFSTSDHGTALTFSTTADGTTSMTEKVRITGAGYVGIGTTAPNYNLHIQAANPTFNLESTNAAAGASSTLNFGHTQGGTTTPIAAIYSSLTCGGSCAAGDLRFSTTSNNVQYDRMTILSAGNVGIGTPSPSYTLHVVGSAGLSTGTAWTNASDIRLKDIRGDYEYGLNEILKMHTVRFSYKKNNPLGLPSDHPMTGIIAQEVQKLIPDAVHMNANGYLELNIDPIHWAVVNSIRDLNTKFEKLNGAQVARIQALEQENAMMRSYLCAHDASAPFCH